MTSPTTSTQLTIDQALALALQFQNAGRAADAESIYRRILAASPNRHEAVYRLGLILLDRRDPAGLELVRRSVALCPDFPEAHVCLGNECQKKGQLDEAIACYRRAILFRPDFPDAFNNLAAMLQLQGKFDDAVAAFRQAVALNPRYFDAIANLANLLVRLERYNEAVPLARTAVELRPGFAPAVSQLANTLRHTGALTEAAEHAAAALRLDPRSFAAHNALGGIHAARKQHQLAADSFRIALDISPDAVDALINYGISLEKLGRHDQALATLLRAKQLEPTNSTARHDLGVVLDSMERFDEALAEYRTAAKLRPLDYQHQNDLAIALISAGHFDEADAVLNSIIALDPARTEARFNLSLNQLITGNFRDGWANYEVRWCQPIFIKQKCNLNKPQWDGQPPAPGAGNTLLICPEQGLGDMIQFARFTPRAIEAGWNVILEVQPLLRSLFEFATPKLAHKFITWPADPQKDYASVDSVIHIGSMPMALHVDPTSPDFLFTPYLQPDPDKVAAWRDRIGQSSRPKVGLVWAGSPRHHRDKERSIPLTHFAPLADCNATFFSLQLGPAADQLKNPPPGLHITDLSPDIKDFTDTAAILAQLDLLITVDSAPAHLAGALGRPCWVLLTHIPDFRWLTNRTDSPWYPTLRLYRQPRRNHWPAAIQQIAQDLAKFAP